MNPQQTYGQAVALHRDGKLAEAERLYIEVLAAAPGNFSARHMLGVAHAQQGRHAEALETIGAALQIKPGAADALVNYGNVLCALDRHEEALVFYDRAVAIAPGDAEAWNNRGNALNRLGSRDEALASFNRALAIQPGHRDAHFGKASIFQDRRGLDAALASYDKALAIDPGYIDALNNRGVVLWNLGRNAEALAGYDAALAIAPELAATWSNRGNALRSMGRLEDALESFDRAIAADPDYAEAYQNKAFCLLAMENFTEGWRLHEWRKRLPQPVEARRYRQPLWTGAENLAGKTLFVYVEQGLGDTIQFYRYAAQTGAARVILSAQDCLTRLLCSAGNNVELVGAATPADFDYHIPLMSLPLALGTDRDTFPARVSYLRAETERAVHWRARIGNAGFKVGLCWRGAPRANMDFGRSIPLAQFAALAKIPGVRLISLQKNDGTEELGDLPPGMIIEQLGAFDDGPDAFLDTAAVMENLDLIVTMDTSLAHLAGALGRPTWLALKYAPDWRWFLGRSDSPWYPTMRLFRQSSQGDWAGVFARMEEKLAKEIQ